MSGLSPQFILGRSLCREPHCFSAWVQGEGYTLRDPANPEFLRQYWREAQSAIENLDWSDGYAEPGYEQPRRGVLLADWNIFPKEAIDLLERAGFAIEWSDEWSHCDDCGKIVRTEPDGYDWEPFYRFDGESTLLCRNCDPLTAVGELVMAFSDEREPTIGFLADVACGLYWYCHNNHDGQWSAEYKILSQLDYKPGALEIGPPDESTAADIHEALEDGELDAEQLHQWFELAWARAKERE